jgi:hypothetical protein
MFLFEPGIAPSFAVAPEGAPSSVFFRPISMDFMNPIPGSFAVGSPGDYFRTVVMSFDADGSPGADLSMTIDTRSLASTNGFKRVPEPSGLHFVPLILGLWPATARVCQRDGRRAARRLA